MWNYLLCLRDPFLGPVFPGEQGIGGGGSEAGFVSIPASCHLLDEGLTRKEPEKAKGNFHLIEHLVLYGHCYKHFTHVDFPSSLCDVDSYYAHCA